MRLSITIAANIKPALYVSLCIFTKNPVKFMHARYCNYLFIIYYNSILLPKIQFRSHMQEIVAIY